MLLSIAMIFLVGILLSEIFKKLNLPGLLGMMLAGIIIGPFYLDLINSQLLDLSNDLRKLALIVILIRAGLNLDLSSLRKIGKSSILISFLPATIEILVVTILAPIFFDISLLEAAMMGSIVAAVSPAVIVPRMIKLMESGHGDDKNIPQMIMAGASVDDIYVIIIFTSLLSVYNGQNFNATQFLQIPISILAGMILGILSGKILSWILKNAKVTPTLNSIILFGSAIFIASVEPILSGFFPVSTLLSIMIFSFIVKMDNTLLAIDLERHFKSIWSGAEILLFVLLGVSIDVVYLLKAGPLAITLILVALIFRIIGVNLALVKSNLNNKERLFCSIAYLPKATVQAAIGSIPLAMGVDAGGIILTVAALTIILTAPLGAIGIDLTYDKLLSLPKLKEEFSYRD
ncbi:MAG: cation:proton antiporter [Clostridia bacterium]